MSDRDEASIVVIDTRLGASIPLLTRKESTKETSDHDISKDKKITARVLRRPAFDNHPAANANRVQMTCLNVPSRQFRNPNTQTGIAKLVTNQSPGWSELDAVRRLADSEARSHSIIETAPDAFIGIDLESRILNWNTQATAIFGWSREEAIGRTLWDTIIPSQFHHAHRHGMHRFRKTGEPPVANHRIELSARHRDGREFPIEMTISGPISSESGDFFGAFLRDISQRREREDELRKAKEAAVSHARTLELLNGISRELCALLDTDELLKRIGELLYQLVEYHTFSVLLLDSSGKTLKHRFSLSGSKIVAKPDIPIDQGLVGFAARNRQPVVVDEVSSDSRYIKFHEETRSELSVPLITKDKLIGVLDIENSSPSYFRDSHVQAITILASQLAVALDNSLLYERVRGQERQLNQDLRFARKMQRRLLSDELPVMKNAAVATLSWPARIIAGDIFDFAYYRKSGLHVGILADVTGKGAPAALYAALTSGIIRLLVERELAPAAMLEAVNRALLERPLEAQFVALTYTLWDDARRILRIANSGLPRPVRFSKGSMEIIQTVGTPLGLLPGSEYNDHCLQAAPGEIFVFLTDGILEACNLKGEEFGYSGLERALQSCENLSANKIRDALANEIKSHCDGVEPGDDQTLIVFKAGAEAGETFVQPAGNVRVRTGELTLV